jgi:hypothetical protein
MLLMVNDADRAGHHRGAGGAQGAAGQPRPGQAGSGLVSGPLGLTNQGGDDRSAAGLAIQHTFGGVSLTSKATKSRPAAGGRAGAGKAGLAGAKRANSGAPAAGAAAAAASGSAGGPTSSSGSRQQQQQQDMGVSAAGRQRKRKALYAGDGQEWVVPPAAGSKDESEQVPAPPHVLPQHHPHHQIRRGCGGDSSGSLGQLTAAAAAAAGHAGGVQDPPGVGLPAQQPPQQQHVQQYPQQRGGDSASESDGTVYCMCLQAHDQDYFISCDRCGDWCHVKCVGMTIAAARAAKSWCCPLCWSVSGDTTALAATSERLAKVCICYRVWRPLSFVM